MSQQGGSEWFVDHLALNGFDPFVFDGRDPAAFAWAIFEAENRLEAASKAARSRGDPYPLPLPYGIAVAPKGRPGTQGACGPGATPCQASPQESGASAVARSLM